MKPVSSMSKSGSASGDGFEHPPQIVLVEFGQFREAVVGEQVGEFLGVAGVVLFVHGDRFAADQQCGFQPAVTADDQARALRHGDRVAPALLLDDRGQKLDLVGAVAVRIDRVRLERVRIDEAGVGAMHGDAHGTRPCRQPQRRLTRPPRRDGSRLARHRQKAAHPRLRQSGRPRAEGRQADPCRAGDAAIAGHRHRGRAQPPPPAMSNWPPILGITRQSINTWKKRKDAPKPAANGLHDVAAWREFMRRNDLKGGEPAAQDAADIETSLKARKLLAEVEERELRLGIRRGDFVAVEEVRQTWTEFVAQATAMLRKKFEQELPPILSGLDATGIQEEARRAIDEVLTILHQGE